MNWLTDLSNFIWQTLLQEILVVIIGVLFAQTIRKRLDKRKYGNWHVEIWEKGNRVLLKEISPGKAKAIFDIPEDMGVFLKGLVSPFGWLNCDLMDDGPELGLLEINHKSKIIKIDMDKNPPKEEDVPTSPHP